ncbi:MAG: RagB/SusD family nutrient uptake outer membrane protein [Pedobacter sp.]|nr:RagB/SusD family nutrient uptake outer membrane protein [Pedobacter sp.]MDQ8052090.1 RagB/SusD family nutrient uptake outer membrane protein [Pedobacter sp.]
MKNLKYTAALMAVVLGLSSCEKTLEVAPRDQIAAEQALTSLLGVNSLLNTAYSNLRGTTYYGQSLKILPDIMADNIYPIPGLNSNRLITNSVNQAGAHMSIWSLYTTGVNQANLVIDAVGKLEGAQADKNKLLGQALGLRSLFFFDMVRVYAYNPKFIPIKNGSLFNYGIPLVLKPTTSVSTIEYPKRATVDEVYTQIEADLLQAEGLLDNSLGNKYMTQNVVRAILAKVYLTWGKYDKAAIYADKVITTSGSTFQTGANYANMFYADNNPEAIFDIVITSEQSNINESLQSYYAQFPADYSKRQDPVAFANINEPKVGYGDFSPTPELLALYEAGDVRRNVINTSNKNGTTVTYARKWVPTKGANFLQNIPLMRITEMYLIRAEGNFRAGTSVGATAQADLDKIRLRAGLTSVPVTADAILKERRIELAFEGDRWFDLLRLGQDIPKSTALGALAPISYQNDFRILAPIPNADLAVNPNLVRNLGY